MASDQTAHHGIVTVNNQKLIKTMHIAIITSEPFPNGMAATNRFRAYAKELVRVGNKVTVYIVKPTEVDIKTANPTQGVMEGVRFYYSNNSNIYPSNPLSGFLSKTIGLIKGYLIIRRQDKEDSINRIILVSNYAYLMLAGYFLAKLIGARYIQEKSEFPFVLNGTGILGRIYAKFYVNCLYRLFDGFIVMTGALENYYKHKGRKSARFLLLPMSVDFDRFNIKQLPARENTITYSGSMDNKKDGVDLLIRAFGIVHKEHPDWNLVLIGEIPSPDISAKMKTLVKSLQIAGNVIFTGKVSREQIPHLLYKSKILALARPSSMQAAGGFPTKLGEYLATGNPVVVTSVGEIPHYLEDGKSCYMAQPDSAEQFAGKLIYVIEHYEEAEIIGQEGRRIAEEYFSSSKQGEKLADFLRTI
jgi:glycosyltransferase involved in cell wall biosynthesis